MALYRQYEGRDAAFGGFAIEEKEIDELFFAKGTIPSSKLFRYAMYRGDGNHSQLNAVYGCEVNPLRLNAVNRV